MLQELIERFLSYAVGLGEVLVPVIIIVLIVFRKEVIEWLRKYL